MPDVRAAFTASAPPAGRGWERRSGLAAAAVVLGLFYLLLMASVREKSATFDEPGHAFAGSAYWRIHDYRFDPENGNLPQRWFGLALLTVAQTFPATDAPGTETADNWKLADTWLNRSGNDVSAILSRGRAAAGLFAVALGAVVFLWSRRLFGPAGGMVSLLLFVLNPTVLAHGALMTSDMAAALFFTVALGCFWAMLERFTVWRVVLSALAMGALFLTKMSAVLIVPVVLLLATLRVLERRPIQGGWGQTWTGNTRREGVPSQSIGSAVQELTGRGQKFLALLAAATAHVGLIALMIWTAYGFRFNAQPKADLTLRFAVPWEALLDLPSPSVLLRTLDLSVEQQTRGDAILRSHGADGAEWTHGALDAIEAIKREVLQPAQATALEFTLGDQPIKPVARLVQFARWHHLLPEAYVYGVAHVWRLMGERGAFLNGEVSRTGWLTFFPYSFAVKTPLATFVIFALGIAAFVLADGSRGSFAGTLPLALFIATYWAAAMTSEINLGMRHLLPVHPAMFILAGAAARWSSVSAENARSRWLRFAAPGLLVVLAADVMSRFPHYIAYFNGIVRPADGYRHLIDSSLDWGQELPALKRAMERESGDAPRFLAYFGTASPRTYGIAARQIYSFLESDRAEQPAMKIITGPQDDAAIVAVLQQMPDYDPSLVFPAQSGEQRATLLVKRSAALRLTAGTYYISASLLPPVHYPRAHGRWSEQHEAVYQQLRAAVQPLFSEQRATRVAAVNRLPPAKWNQIVRDFEEFRFARLAASLRERQPDGNVNFAILFFRLSEAELEAALNGPPPLNK